MPDKYIQFSFRSSVEHADLVPRLQSLSTEIGERSFNKFIERLLLEGLAREEKKLLAVRKEEKPITFIDTLLTDYYDLYEISRDVEYLNKFSGKDRSAMGKLLALHKKKMPESNSDQTKASIRAFFEACMKIKDPWLHENLSVPIILSKINQINIILRNNGKQPRKVTSSDIVSIVEGR